MAHVLLPTDFSANALNAACYGVRLFGVEGNRFTLLHTLIQPQGSVDVSSIDDVLVQAATEASATFAQRLRDHLPGMKPALDTAIEHGALPHVVARFASDTPPPDLVVMGTQGATGLQEVLVGTNTADVVRSGGLPVLAVPEQATYSSPRRILLADDAGPVDKTSLKVLLSIARWSHSEVTIVRVVSDDASMDSENTGSVYDTLLGAIPHTYHYLSGDNVQAALNDMVDQGDVDLLVVLHRQRGILDSFFHRSASARMVMHTHVPMLVLRQAMP